MGKNIVEKILEKHVIDKGENEIGIKIDQTLTQDATGTAAYLEFESMGVKNIKTELSVSYVDHNTVQVGFENADDHEFLRTVAEKYGISFSRPGNGICHQVHLERFACPGKTLIGSDSHTPTAGGIGSLAIGAGGLDVVLAIAGKPFYIPKPKVMRINLNGKLKNWVSAKDIVLKVLETLTTKGNVGYIIEYGGDGIKNLSVPERATITNMGAETGVTSSVFPSDKKTKEFMRMQNRENEWVELKADDDAKYDEVIDINLDEIVPMVACPHSPGNVKKVEDIEGMNVDQVLIGSCTNSSYRDLMIVSKILKGKKIPENVSFGIAPGSRQVLSMIAENGALADMLSAGARILESACGFCIGNSQSPKTNSVSLRTNNRNFLGRSGTKSANVYLVSPETATVSALNGKLTDPRKFGEYPEIEMPEKFLIDDSMIIKNKKDVEIYRGPNIVALPKNESMPNDIKGRIMIKVGDLITTDHIMPAGKLLKYRSNIVEYSKHVFEPVDQTFAERCMDNKGKAHNVIVGGLSYGQGSSREHAALCPMYLGVKAVIAKSIERIHKANLVNFGILPLIFENESDYDLIDKEDVIEIKNVKEKIEKNENVVLENITKNKKINLKYDLSDREKNILFAGGLLNMG
ncbi:MAG: aconitate hydratase [Candidatus Thermoplasmatota archaeon]|nr:aconitate hydratase [Candidatus Thermoplasmatota archaeon]